MGPFCPGNPCPRPVRPCPRVAPKLDAKADGKPPVPPVGPTPLPFKSLPPGPRGEDDRRNWRILAAADEELIPDARAWPKLPTPPAALPRPPPIPPLNPWNPPSPGNPDKTPDPTPLCGPNDPPPLISLRSGSCSSVISWKDEK